MKCNYKHNIKQTLESKRFGLIPEKTIIKVSFSSPYKKNKKV